MRGFDIVMYCFDLSDANSWSELLDLAESEYHRTEAHGSCAAMLVGCKCDKQKSVSELEIQDAMEKYPKFFREYWQVSALTMENVDALRTALEKRITRAYNAKFQKTTTILGSQCVAQ